MKTKHLERVKAIELREKGLSLREILEEVPVAKSTLSLWLRDVGLSKPQVQRLTQKKLDAAKRGGQKKYATRLLKSQSIQSQAILEVNGLYPDSFWLAGVMLYWAEGAKEKAWRSGERVSFSNMDWRMILVFRNWLMKYLSLSTTDLEYSLYLHEGSDVAQILTFWSEKLNIMGSDIAVYTKGARSYTQRKNVEEGYKGVFRVRARRSVDLNRKISGWIDGVFHYLVA